MSYIKVSDEVDAVVRVRIFGSSSYMNKLSNFTVKEIKDGVICGVSTYDGSISYFNVSKVTTINGMAISRYKIAETKEGIKET